MFVVGARRWSAKLRIPLSTSHRSTLNNRNHPWTFTLSHQLTGTCTAASHQGAFWLHVSSIFPYSPWLKPRKAFTRSVKEHFGGFFVCARTNRKYSSQPWLNLHRNTKQRTWTQSVVDVQQRGSVRHQYELSMPDAIFKQPSCHSVKSFFYLNFISTENQDQIFRIFLFKQGLNTMDGLKKSRFYCVSWVTSWRLILCQINREPAVLLRRSHGYRLKTPGLRGRSHAAARNTWKTTTVALLSKVLWRSCYWRVGRY